MSVCCAAGAGDVSGMRSTHDALHPVVLTVDGTVASLTNPLFASCPVNIVLLGSGFHCRHF